MASFFEKLKRGVGIETAENPKIEEEKKEESEVVKKEKPPVKGHQGFSLESLNKEEGELAVDVYQTDEDLIIRSAIAGVKPEKLDVLIEQDVITISGNREEPEEKGKIDYFSRECYFGPFSRKIISPVEIDSSRAKAVFKEGILIIRMPKIQREKKVKLEIGIE